MAATKTVIIHGWSDCSESFVALKKYLAAAGLGAVDTIYYADYESREDNITFDDVVQGLNDRMIQEGFIDHNGKALADLNVVVHSTGGLVIRHWIARYYLGPKPRIEECPIRRIVMLAPANFGSPLAHRGKSFLGELFKGRWKVGDFLEVGRLLLDGLELGSPYHWRLAHRDLLSGLVPYAADRIQLTILVGIEDYTGLRGWVNKSGTDGTVVIAGTSLDTLKLTLDCTKSEGEGADYLPYSWGEHKVVDDFAFGVLPDLNHGTIVSEVGKPDGGTVGPLMLRALTAETPRAFQEHAGNLDQLTELTYRATGRPRYQQFIVHSVDDADNAIADFTIEFFICRADRASEGVIANDRRLTKVELSLSEEANRIITAQVHPHSIDPSFRRFLINLTSLRELLNRATTQEQGLGAPVALSMRIYVPRVDRGIQYAVDELQNIVLLRTDGKERGPKFLYANTTTLLELRVNRKCEYVWLNLKPRKD